jgi:hypothetical protein
LENELSQFTADFCHENDVVSYGGFRVHKDYVKTDKDFTVVQENPKEELDEYLAVSERYREFAILN